ncbi:MAG: hypothetical protein JOS17DRAFT_489984 [Linnemannia elongata]|nr:MAG: hypothetical protein JOS17DRAFT_489984 [Linnemannia elongata]
MGVHVVLLCQPLFVSFLYCLCWHCSILHLVQSMRLLCVDQLLLDQLPVVGCRRIKRSTEWFDDRGNTSFLTGFEYKKISSASYNFIFLFLSLPFYSLLISFTLLHITVTHTHSFSHSIIHSPSLTLLFPSPLHTYTDNSSYTLSSDRSPLALTPLQTQLYSSP